MLICFLRSAEQVAILGSWNFVSQDAGGRGVICASADHLTNLVLTAALFGKPILWSHKLDKKDIDAIKSVARQAAERAYCPYSRFSVGAVIVTRDGKQYSGCNIENTSYGLTVCAERVAVFQAVSAGERALELLLLYTPTQEIYTPCGACRQVLFEFARDLRIYCTSNGDVVREYGIRELLLDGFAL